MKRGEGGAEAGRTQIQIPVISWIAKQMKNFSMSWGGAGGWGPPEEMYEHACVQNLKRLGPVKVF